MMDNIIDLPTLVLIAVVLRLHGIYLADEKLRRYRSRKNRISFAFELNGFTAICLFEEIRNLDRDAKGKSISTAYNKIPVNEKKLYLNVRKSLKRLQQNFVFYFDFQVKGCNGIYIAQSS